MSLKTKLNGLFYLLKPSTKLYLPIGVKKNVVIYDDFFPNPVTGFRLDEFTYLLNCIDSSKIIIDSEASNRSENLKEFFVKQGQGISKNRIAFASRINNINAKIVYIIFYFNVMKIFKFLEVFHIRYIVTLYPGGGFVINDDNVDKNLKRILGTELCRAVIVNQRFTRQYLLEKKFAHLIRFI